MLPTQLTSDHGTQFTGAVGVALCGRLGIKHRQTTAMGWWKEFTDRSRMP